MSVAECTIQRVFTHNRLPPSRTDAEIHSVRKFTSMDRRCRRLSRFSSCPFPISGSSFCRATATAGRRSSFDGQRTTCTKNRCLSSRILYVSRVKYRNEMNYAETCGCRGPWEKLFPKSGHWHAWRKVTAAPYLLSVDRDLQLWCQ